MSKYITLGIVVCFWFILPFILSFVGIYSIEKEDFAEIQGIDEPTETNFVYQFVNYLGYFFRILTFSLPNAPRVIKWILFMFIPISVLALISVLRGD